MRMDIIHRIPAIESAEVAELVDAHDSGSCVRKDVEVRVLSSAFRNAGRAAPGGRRINFRLRSKIILSSIGISILALRRATSVAPTCLGGSGLKL